MPAAGSMRSDGNTGRTIMPRNTGSPSSGPTVLWGVHSPSSCDLSLLDVMFIIFYLAHWSHLVLVYTTSGRSFCDSAVERAAI